MRISNNMFIAGLTSFLLACGGSPEKAIVKYWVPDLSSETAEQRYSTDDVPEIEFRKDGTVNMYTDGTIFFSTKYTMATDGKSLMIYEPSGREEPISMEIISLSSKRLELVPITTNAFGSPRRGDVQVFKPKK